MRFFFSLLGVGGFVEGVQARLSLKCGESFLTSRVHTRAHTHTHTNTKTHRAHQSSPRLSRWEFTLPALSWNGRRLARWTRARSAEMSLFCRAGYKVGVCARRRLSLEFAYSGQHKS